MWAWLIPVLKSVLVNFTIESLADWGTCFATASVCSLVSAYDESEYHEIVNANRCLITYGVQLIKTTRHRNSPVF